MTMTAQGTPGASPAVGWASLDATLQLTERALWMQRALQRYNGRGRRQLTPRVGEPDDNLQIGLARTIVDVGAAYLFGEDSTSAMENGPPAAQDWLDQCWTQNKRGQLLTLAAIWGGITGHCFIRLLPRQPFPRLVVLDSTCMQIGCAPDDIGEIWGYTYQPPPYSLRDGEPPTPTRTLFQSPSAVAGYRVPAAGPWIITEQIFQNSAWTTTASERWPFDWPPIADAPNLVRPGDVWGESDLPPDIIHLLESLDRVMSHANKISRLYSHPKVYTTGMGPRTLQWDLDGVIALPSETAKLAALETPADMPAIMALADKIVTFISWCTKIPAVALGQEDAMGAISGVAVQLRYRPLVQKTEQKRRSYGDLITTLDKRMLLLGGWGEHDSSIQWPELLPSNGLEEAQIAVIQESLGASRATLLERLGFDPEQEAKQRAEEQPPEPPAPVVPPPQAIPGPQPAVAQGAAEPKE